MDKLKKSAVAKVVAAILLSVSLFMAAVSSCVVVAAISYGGSSQMQAEAIYDGYMGNLVDNSSYQVDEYYKAYVESQDDTPNIDSIPACVLLFFLRNLCFIHPHRLRPGRQHLCADCLRLRPVRHN